MATQWYTVVVMIIMKIIPAMKLASQLDEVTHLIKLNGVIAVPPVIVMHTMRASYQAAYHPGEEIILHVTQRQNR